MNIIVLLLFSMTWSFSQDLKTVTATVASKDQYQYSNSIEELQNGEKWGWHSKSLGDLFASSCLSSSDNIEYNIENIADFDLSTAWVEGNKDYGVKEYFTYNVKFRPGNEYGSSGEFYGKVEVFNGYCKNEAIWKANSRVKKLKMYLNDVPVCYIQLQDTWQYQSFSIAEYFKNRVKNENLDAKFELKSGDVLKFEIVEIYPGSKYKDTAISEFVVDGAPN